MRKPGKEIWSLTLVAVGYMLVFETLYNWLRYHDPAPYRDVLDFLKSSWANLVPIWVMCVLIWGVVWHIPIHGKTWLKVSVDLLVTVAVMVLVNILVEVVTPWHVEWAGAAFNTLFIFLGISVYYYIVQYRETLEKEALAREETLRYRYDALKAHVNPHFLFNSLNILSSLVTIDAVASRKFIISLSRLYRYIMAKESCETVTVEEELSFLRNYIEVLEMRYGDNLRVNILVDEGCEQRQLIPYTMQLLMENVIKHNIISGHSPMVVTVSIGVDGLLFSNPIRLKSAETVSKIGIRYLTNLYALHGREFSVERKDGMFTVIAPYLN